MRLTPASVRRRNPLQRQSELLLEHEQMGEPRLIVRGQGEQQRSLWTQFHIHPRRRQQLCRESGPARLAFPAKRDQSLLTGLRLRARRQHTGGRMARARTGRAPIENSDCYSPRREPPCNGKSDHSRANDGDAWLTRIGGGAVRQPAAPFAGMTQTGSMGMISAASARHPRPSNLMMGILAVLHKAMCGAPQCRGSVGSQ